MKLEYLSFHPIKKKGSLIGFASFKYNGQFSFAEVDVHKINMPVNPKRTVRILYPEKVFPFKKEIQEEIDEEISAYVSANYKETLI